MLVILETPQCNNKNIFNTRIIHTSLIFIVKVLSFFFRALGFLFWCVLFLYIFPFPLFFSAFYPSSKVISSPTMMAASPHVACALCHQASKQECDAGPSSSSSSPIALPRGTRPPPRLRRFLRQLSLGISVAVLAIAPTITSASALYSQVQMQDRNALSDLSILARDTNKPREPAAPLADLIRKRAYSSSQVLGFEVDVSPPTTCEPMNITFNTQGGVAPFTIFVGFSDWYAYTVSIPSTYADADVQTWLYQFNVPVFRPFVSPSSPTPNSVVVVSDSTGNLMNSSSFQTVVEGDTSCAGVSGLLDFTFYTDQTITTCSPLQINWGYTAPLPGWKDPLDIFLLPERAPPVHIPVSNSSAGQLSYNVTLQPGTNVMLTMMSQGGSGGVSGENTVGGSEYVGQECLVAASSSIVSIGLPTPTTTLSNLRMPDYTAVVSSLITSNGVLKTSVAVETFRNGSSFGGSVSHTAEIAGVAAGIGILAAVVAAVISWWIWRKRSGRANLLWDVPRSMEGELNKRDGSEPIDQGYLRNRSKAMSRTESATAPMLPGAALPSDSSEELISLRMSGTEGNSFSSQQSPPGSAGRYKGNRVTSFGLYQDNSSEAGSPGAGGSRTRRGSGSSSTTNPFANTYAVSQSSRNYRTPFLDRREMDGVESVEAMAMRDINNGSSSRHDPSEASAASFYESSRPSNPTYVQHSDAGLLLDDSLENEADVGGQIELPPQYTSVPRRANPRRGNASRSAGGGGSEGSPSQTLDVTSAARTIYTEDDGDDSKFWRSIPEPE